MCRRFSDRMGITSPLGILQLDGMSDALKNRLWNYYSYRVLRVPRVPTSGILHDYLQRGQVGALLCDEFLKIPNPGSTMQYVWWHKEKFFALEWYDIYNLLEFVVEHEDVTLAPTGAERFRAGINQILEEEMSGFRFVDDVLAPISSKEEIGSISAATQTAAANKLQGTEEHLKTAVGLLARKPEPDYRNSIKESISAVESLVKQLAGEKGGGLKPGLETLDAAVRLHPAFKAGLLSLYGYTSDEDGIRHAILEERDVGFDEAKYMLVACSALVNFLISKATKHGML